ncbi:MAG: AAA family ATPase, partial [Candidatus Diapherotrites archaeon]|nr:AAA family ATPase [Candidatus Diapherotrites archaeon]
IEELEGVVVIAATNRPDLLDPGLMRPGRFDKKILIDTPNEDARFEVFKVHTKSMPLAKDVDLKSLASRTVKYSGADIAAICREAALFALRESKSSKEIKETHFDKALKKVNVGLRSMTQGMMVR